MAYPTAYNDHMSEPFVANIGGWIGRGIANGDPMAWGVAGTVIATFVAAYRLLAWTRTQ